jgi:hypothetical protein
VHELNSLQTEKSSLLLKIQDLEEKLLERITGEKLTHMLSIQKSPTDKTGLGYVAFTSDIPSTSKTIFVMPTVPEPPPACMDKGKAAIGGDVLVEAKPTQMPLTKRKPPKCHHYGLSGHIRPKCQLVHAQQLKVKKESPRKATLGIRPLKKHQAPQHQRQQQRFVPANHNGKPKKNKSRHYKKKPQKTKSDQSYEELPTLMRSLLRWMDNQMKAYQ